MNDSRFQRLGQLAWVFLRLGTTAFGGPAAHIAFMQEECVLRRGWLSSQEFLDLLAGANLIPGPTSTELCIHIGYRRGGVMGLVVAGACFILPSALMCAGLAELYRRFGTLPATVTILYYVTPVVIAIVAQAIFKLGKATMKSWPLAVVGMLALVALMAGANELATLAVAGVVTAMMAWVGAGRGRGLPMLVWPMVAVTGGVVGRPTMGAIFLVFLKIGSVLFGSGYVLLAFLRADLVERYGWLTERQLLDAVAVGQVTPGPVFTTATFIGYLVGGPAGAGVATVGIFLPAFVMVGLTAPILKKLRQWRTFGAFLDGLNAGSVALMAWVTILLARAAILGGGGMPRPVPVVLAVLSLGLLLWKNVNSVYLVLAAAALGIIQAAMGLG